MRVLLAPHGSRGDVQPMLALARALRDRRHSAAFVAPANFVPWIESHGFAASSNGIDVEAVLQSAGADLHSLRWQMRHLGEGVDALFASVARASDDADLIVGSGIQMAAASVAEWRGVPCANAVFCPCALPSAAAPPPPVKTQTLPRWVNRLLWDASGPLVSLAIRSHINRGRATLGLGGVRDVLEHLVADLALVAADPDLAPLADDAPRRAVATDAWTLDAAGPLAPRVDEFLSRDPSPVYIGFGSMIAKDVDSLAAAAVDGVRAVGRRAIVAGGWGRLDRHVVAADDLMVVDQLPHDSAFPRVAAVVHHGGAGTTTAAARAGVPQVLVPHILDQYYWGHRIAAIGLGPRAVPADLATADILADRIDRALSDPAIRSRAGALAPVIRARNGAPAAVLALERLVSA
jgi:UDP:flavonoid glycosyltransferase YjiC (YdhE family)